LKQSCAKLLASKFTLERMKKVYDKFGPSLTSPKGNNFLKPSYKVTGRFLINASPNVVSLYEDKTEAAMEKTCSVCGSTHKVEYHHVRAMKDLKPKISI
jgi:hypothetical protein